MTLLIPVAGKDGAEGTVGIDPAVMKDIVGLGTFNEGAAAIFTGTGDGIVEVVAVGHDGMQGLVAVEGVAVLGAVFAAVAVDCGHAAGKLRAVAGVIAAALGGGEAGGMVGDALAEEAADTRMDDDGVHDDGEAEDRGLIVCQYRVHAVGLGERVTDEGDETVADVGGTNLLCTIGECLAAEKSAGRAEDLLRGKIRDDVAEVV